MSRLVSYSEPIIYACILFLPISVIITLPYMVFQYRRLGGIPVLRIVIFYSFVLYMMCAFFLTALPLPDFDKVAQMPDKTPQLIPFQTYIQAFSKAGFSFSDPASFFHFTNWKKFITSFGLFEILANIIMQIPLGIYLRYYFRRSWKQTLLIGFCVSLFYELTQLSGLFFLYPKAYRLCSVDDLIDNTLGAMIGYWIMPKLFGWLPTVDELNKIAIAKGVRATIPKRVAAAVIDWGIYFSIVFCLRVFVNPGTSMPNRFEMVLYLAWIYGVFVLLQRIWKGRTLGKWLCRIRIIDSETQKTPGIPRLIIRYTMLYMLLPAVLILFCIIFMIIGLAIMSGRRIFQLLGMIGMFGVLGFLVYKLVGLLRNPNRFLHSRLSKTEIKALPPKKSLELQ